MGSLLPAKQIQRDPLSEKCKVSCRKAAFAFSIFCLKPTIAIHRIKRSNFLAFVIHIIKACYSLVANSMQKT